MCVTSTCVLFFFLYSYYDLVFFFFFFNDTATTEIYTLSLHDALPIYIVESQDIQNQFSFWPRYDQFVEAKPGAPVAGGESYRSEERRVGKECRSRWSPYH